MRNTSPASDNASAATNHIRRPSFSGSSASATPMSATNVAGFATYSSAFHPRATATQFATANAAATPSRKPAASVIRPSSSDLALLAQEVRATAVLDAGDLVPAPPAPLAGAVVDHVLRRELAHLAEQVAVLLVGQRRAAVLDRLLQDLAHG